MRIFVYTVRRDGSLLFQFSTTTVVDVERFKLDNPTLRVVAKYQYAA